MLDWICQMHLFNNASFNNVQKENSKHIFPVTALESTMGAPGGFIDYTFNLVSSQLTIPGHGRQPA